MDDETRKKQIAAIVKRNWLLLALAIFLIVTSFGLTLSGTVNLAGRGGHVDNPTELDKLTFTTKYFVLHALWFIFAVRYVGRHRDKIPPLAGKIQRFLFT